MTERWVVRLTVGAETRYALRDGGITELRNERTWFTSRSSAWTRAEMFSADRKATVRKLRPKAARPLCCCQHGCEDGRCEPIDEEPPASAGALTTDAKLVAFNMDNNRLDMIVSHYPPTLYLGRTYRVTFADITEEKAEGRDG